MEPAHRQIAGEYFYGLRYRYLYKSSDIPIYYILDRGSWAPGGSIIGNEFWMRNCFAPSIYVGRDMAEYYSTEWYLPSCPNPNIFQFLPLQTELQGFTFTAGAKGVLVTWPTKVAHIRSLFYKPKGSGEMHHVHEHCGDLGLKIETSPMEVLFAAGHRSRAEWMTLHGAWFDFVANTLHKQINMKRERMPSYGMIEEWSDADLVHYRAQGLPKLAAAGVKNICLANQFQNNMNTYGVSNMCCTLDYKVAETVGENNLGALCQDARHRRMRIEMWGNTAISTLTFILHQRNGKPKRIKFLKDHDNIMAALAKAKSPFVRNTFYGIEADHYTPVFAVLNLRDPVVRNYWLRRWGYAHRQIGIDGIFLDSSFNLSSDKFHFCYNAEGDRGGATPDQTAFLGWQRPAQPPRAEILSQYHAHLTLMAQMQRLGIHYGNLGIHYGNEDLGVFGIHRHGPAAVKRLTSLFMWSECAAVFDAPAIRQAGHDPNEIFFRGFAYRQAWIIFWHPQRDEITFRYEGAKCAEDIPTPWHIAIVKAYNAVAPHMDKREVLHDEKGVIYHGQGGRQVLWSFAELEMPLPRPRLVWDVLRNEKRRLAAVRAQRHAIYLIGGYA